MSTQDISQLVVEVKSSGILTASNQLDKLATSADKAEAAVKKLGTAVIGANNMLNGGVASATALATAMVSLTVVLERMSQSQLRVTTTTRANNEAMAEAHALARGLSGSLGALWVTYGNFAGMAAGIALGASLKGVIGVGKDVEQTLEGIRVLGGATTGEMVKMSKAINDLGTGTSGPKEVAEALKTLTLAGLNAEQSLQGVGAALNLAIGGEVSIEKSAETLVQVGSALGYTAASFDHVSDVIVKTAAASMSSVDSISGAFKSAAAIGTTYGASLQDIAVGLAAVANLGIQGTAAGTALKNLYKDLSASTDKVTNTLKDMKMSITSFRDAQGFMLPLVEVIQKLDAGMNTLSSQARNMAMVKLFGQQGLREGAALISLLHQAAIDTDKYGTRVDATHNKLVELQDQIRNSAATAALAAIQMSQTTENQFKSVKNTLLTTFSKVFTEIQPQIGSIGRALREAFASEEFKNGLKTVIGLLVDFTKVLFDNAAVIRDIAMGIAGAKFLEMASGMRLAAGAAATFQAALGPIALLITGLTVAWKMYKAEKDRALSNKDAEGNLEDYIAQVQKETEKQVSLYNLRLKYGSDAEAQRAQEIVDRKEASNKAIDEAKTGVQKLLAVRDGYWYSLKESEKKKAQEFMQMDEEQQQAALKKRQFFGQTGVLDNYGRYMEASMAYAKSQALVADQATRAKNAVEALTVAAGANADWSDKEAKKNRIVSPGAGELTGKGGSKADAYNAAIAEFTNDIKAANQDLENAREIANSKFKAGQMGRLQLIEEVADKEVATAQRIARDARAAADIAAGHVGKDGKADKTADVERFRAEAERADKDAEQADKMRSQNKIAAERQMQTEIVALQVKTLNDQGKFVEAAQLKWSTEGKVLWEQAQADAANTGSETAKAYVVVQNAIRDAAMQAAQLKQDTLAFNTALLGVESTLKGFKSATYGTSIDTMFETATEATKKYEAALADAKQKELTLALAAGGIGGDDGTPEAKKAYAEAHNEMLAIGDKQKTMWQEVGQTITDSLTGAFGKSGTALGELYKGVIKYQQTENATASDRINQYGDMTNAASGFFDKSSKGYKALHAVSEAFHLAAMARTLAQTAASIVAGAAQFFAQSGWGGFAGVAAMGAVLAGLGYSMAGGSSHADPKLDAEYVQKHQGTGTVFGDAEAKSESIAKAMDGLKSNSDMMLPVNQAMLNSLKNIEASMVGVAKLAVQNGITNGSNFNVQTGQMNAKGSPTDIVSSVMTTFTTVMFGPLGAKVAGFINNLWGKTKQEIADSGLQLGGRIADLESGHGVSQYAAVKSTTSSWFGLAKSSNTRVLTQGVGDEMSKQFGQIFMSLEDTMKAAAPVLGASAKVVGDSIENMVLGTKKISLKDLKGDDLTNAINSVISEAMDEVAKAAYPQMQAFQQVGEGYAQTVIRVASGIEQANAAMKKLGLTAIDYTNILDKTGDVSYNIVKQTIALKENGTGVGAIMEQVSGAMSDVVSAYTDLVAARKQMQQYGLGSGLSLDTLKGAGDLKTLSSSLTSYYDKFFTEQEKATILTKDMTEKFSAFGHTLPKSREELRSWIEAAASAGNQLDVGQLLSLAAGFDTMQSALEKLGLVIDPFSDDAVKAAKQAYDDAVSKAEAAYSSLEAATTKRKDELQKTVDGLKEVLSTVSEAIKATAPTKSAADAFKSNMSVITRAISTVNGKGDITKVSGLDDAIKGVSSQGTDPYSTLYDYQRAQAEANSALQELSDAGNQQITEAQKEIDLLQSQLDTAKAQLDALKGIDNSVLSVADALANFGAAMASASAAKSNYTAVQAGNAAGGGQGGASQAIESLYKNVLGRASDEAGKAFWMDALLNKGATMSTIVSDFYKSPEFQKTGGKPDAGYLRSIGLPSFDVGTNFVPDDMLAMIHKGERIIPAADNAALEKRLKEDEDKESKQSNDSAMERKMDDLILAMQQGDVANVQMVRESVKLLREWNQNGMPPTRSDS